MYVLAVKVNETGLEPVASSAVVFNGNIKYRVEHMNIKPALSDSNILIRQVNVDQHPSEKKDKPTKALSLLTFTYALPATMIFDQI